MFPLFRVRVRVMVSIRVHISTREHMQVLKGGRAA